MTDQAENTDTMSVSEETLPDVDLDRVADRFKVVEYLLKLTESPPFVDDKHPAALYVSDFVRMFAEDQVQQLMGVSQPNADAKEEKTYPAEYFTEEEVILLKKLVTELSKPAPAPQPQPQPRVERQLPPTPVSHIPGKKTLNQPLPQVGTVRRGPNSRPPLSKEELEATTHAQAQIVAERGKRAFMGMRTGANPGRDHSEE